VCPDELKLEKQMENALKERAELFDNVSIEMKSIWG